MFDQQDNTGLKLIRISGAYPTTDLVITGLPLKWSSGTNPSTILIITGLNVIIIMLPSSDLLEPSNSEVCNLQFERKVTTSEPKMKTMLQSKDVTYIFLTRSAHF